MLSLLLLVAAAIFFLLSALNMQGVRANLTALGLLCWVLATIVARFGL